MYVEIGGIPQWVEIESGPLGAPTLLLVHGGPGASTRFASAMWQSWRKHFTLVHWDQRGAGRTFVCNGPVGCAPMSFARIVADGIEVAEHLHRARDAGNRESKLILLGHSWGSAVAVHMASQRPELFTALVTTGLFVEFGANEAANHARLLAQADRNGDAEALLALQALPGPPYDSPQAVQAHREWADRLTEGTGDAPQPRLTVRPTNLTEEDRGAISAAFRFSTEALFADLQAIDLRRLPRAFELPMFCFMGSHDQQTPCELAEAWFAEVAAPHKAFAVLQGCHHFAHINRPEAFLALLIEHLEGLGRNEAPPPPGG